MSLAAALLLWQSLVINEIHFAPDDADLEFVEVLNRTSIPVALNGWTLEDASGTRAGIAPRGVTLAPGLVVPLVRDGARFAARWPGVTYLELSPWPSLNDTGDRVRLAGPGDEDTVAYTASWGARGVSLERRDPDGPSWHPVNWASSTDAAGATPGRRNSTYAPDRQPPALVAVDRAHRDTVVAWFSEPVLVGSATLDGTPRSAFGAVPGAIRWAFPVPADLGVESVSVPMLEDLFGNVAIGQTAYVVRAPAPYEIRISELMLRPVADPHDFAPDQVAFVEIRSMARVPVTLRAVRIAGRPSEETSPPTTDAPSFPVVLPPGESAVIFDARGHGGADRLLAAFPRVAADRAVPSATWPFGRTLGTTRLLSPDGIELDRVSPNDSWAEVTPEGRSFERYRYDADRPSAWAVSTDPGGATPGLTNTSESFAAVRPASAGDLVLSEIHYAPVGLQPEFVEIYVRSDRAVDANGLHLRVGASDSVRIGFHASAWPPGGVVVVSGSSTDEHTRRGDLAAAFVVPPDTPVLPLRSTLVNTGGEIRLVAGQGDSLDAARWHDGLHHPRLAETRGVSLERVDAGGSGMEAANWRSSVDPAGGTPGAVTFSARPGPATGRWLRAPAVFHPEEAGERASVVVETRDGPALADVEIYDLTGRQVRTLVAGRIVHDSLSSWWDGLDDAGRPLPSAPYVVFARIVDRRGRVRTATTPLVLARPAAVPTEQPR